LIRELFLYLSFLYKKVPYCLRDSVLIVLNASYLLELFFPGFKLFLMAVNAFVYFFYQRIIGFCIRYKLNIIFKLEYLTLNLFYFTHYENLLVFNFTGVFLSGKLLQAVIKLNHFSFFLRKAQLVKKGVKDFVKFSFYMASGLW